MKPCSLFAMAIVLALGACSTPNLRVATTVNAKAALMGNLPADVLSWRVVTAGVDPRDNTMFTLFGNAEAIRYSRSSSAQRYPDGCVLALATWAQQEDSRWFGAKLPADVKSVEFVEITTGKSGTSPYRYRAYEGSPLREAKILLARSDRRATYILSMRAAVMP
jgi:hypothetical protein